MESERLSTREFSQEELDELENTLEAYRPGNYKQMDAIRSTAKWVVGAFSGVAAILVAGVDLEGIGVLDVCNLFQGLPEDSTCGRFYLSLASGVVIVLSVLSAIWLLVGILNPQDTTLQDYTSDKPSRRVKRINRWFVEHPGFVLGDTKDAMPLRTLYRATREAHDAIEAAEGDSKEAKQRTYRGLELNSYIALETARYEHLRQRFMRTVMPIITLIAVLVAVGLLILVWATNPPNVAS